MFSKLCVENMVDNINACRRKLVLKHHKNIDKIAVNIEDNTIGVMYGFLMPLIHISARIIIGVKKVSVIRVLNLCFFDFIGISFEVIDKCT